MSEERFQSIENKLDRLTDVVAEVARQGAQYAALLESHNALAQRHSDLSGKVDTLRDEIYGKEGLYSAMQRNKWVIGLITGLATLLSSGAVSLLVFYLRGEIGT